MPPKLLNDEGDLFVLRPLAHVAEADCDRFSRAMNYPIIPCDLCGSQDGLQRQQVKADAGRVGGEGARAAAKAVLGPDECASVASARPEAFRFQRSRAQRTQFD
jgi:hypothetical protein